MDKLEKALLKLDRKERSRIKEILVQLHANALQKLDIKKLKGREDIFRVRKGDIRILYRKDDHGIFILAIEKRGENTYK
ncbi:MAG: type II toxin-antitoxin system RelE/ParE family toxin [Parcubacteria group bacterium]|nr:type II toxin-antitoxin system RelE/ParE family toxin [Parcubacteria group bacterium]